MSNVISIRDHQAQAWEAYMAAKRRAELGGKHELDNLCVACEPCNLAKSDIPFVEWMEIIQ